jgi:malate dehydrogenase (oxaloacetate-decarboxylating)(NADP+)
MKMAAVKALAELAKEPVPEMVNIAYDETKLIFGKDYIIPKPFDPRLIAKIPPAVAKAAIKSGVATEPIDDWDKYTEELLERMGNDNKITRLLMDRAKANPKRIVFAEADHLDVMKAAQIVHEDGVATPILLGRKSVIKKLMDELEFEADLEIIDPKSDEQSEKLDKYAIQYWERRKRNGVTLFDAKRLMRERNYFAAMMVNEKDADGMISGYARAYPTVIRPVLETIGKFDGVDRVATTNLMLTSKGPIFISDTSINIDPTAKELANIAQMTNYTVKMFGLKPVIAMISYANFGSSKDPHAAKVRKAVKLLHKSNPDMIVDGELQTDFALNGQMLKSKFPFSKLAGKKVNALVFPNLDSANSNYKMLKEQKGVESIGPIMLGMKKPVHILQLGAQVEEIVNMTAIAVVDAQQKEKNEIEENNRKKI